MRQVLAQTSWDATAASINDLINQAIAARRSKKSAVRVAARLTSDARPAKAGETLTTRVAVIGAGPTGLSAAYHLGKDCLLIAQNDRVGGWCRSIEDSGFKFDFAGHIMCSNDPYVHELYKMLL